MMYQAVRVSDKHPIVHAARDTITEATNYCRTLCGAHLKTYSLINLQEPITCARCLGILRRREEGG